MALREIHKLIYIPNVIKAEQNRFMNLGLMYYSHCSEYAHAHEEEPLPSEWYQKAFSKLKRLGSSLKDLDLVDGALFNVNDHSRVFDLNLEQKMHVFKSLARALIGSPAMQQRIRENVRILRPNAECGLPICFDKGSERGPMYISSLTKVSDILNTSAQQRKLVRLTICPQVTQYKIWTGALGEVLGELRSDIENIASGSSCSKEVKMAQQIVFSCRKCLDIAISYDPESTSWMRLAPKKDESSNSRTWVDVLEMFIDLINCLNEDKELAQHVTKLEVMKEGLYQIRDVVIDKNIGYKENRYQEGLVEKKLTKTLGHSSRCLFTLLLYYLYGNVRDIEVDISGGIRAADGGDRFCLYLGKILSSDEVNTVWSGVKHLDRVLRLFKFVWETSGMKGELELQGHLWCTGMESRLVQYRGNKFLLHGIVV